jgi:hypothetical protein
MGGNGTAGAVGDATSEIRWRGYEVSQTSTGLRLARVTP